MFALYITLWLLSGLLAAWIMYAVLDERENDYPWSAVIVLSLIGTVALFIIVMVTAPVVLSRAFKKLDNTIAFKAKEKK